MWRVVGTSVVGASHHKSQTPCQDTCDYRFCTLAGERALVIAIADGAGSAKASEVGSQQAVEQLLRQVGSSELAVLQID
jgi:serine/threonine protein phosphatase PrpC